MKGCRAFTDDEIALLLEELRTPRNRLLFILGLKTGLRIRELLSLKVRDVFQNGQVLDHVMVQKKHTKGKVEGRTLVLHPAVKPYVVALVEASVPLPDAPLFRSRNLFNRSLSYFQAWRILNTAARRASLTGKISTHSMRKTFAQRMHIILGGDIYKTQKALGHKSVTSTASYLYVGQGEIDEAMLKL